MIRNPALQHVRVVSCANAWTRVGRCFALRKQRGAGFGIDARLANAEKRPRGYTGHTPEKMIAPIAGLLAGIAHAVSGPDHLAAVAPLALSGGERRWRVGVRWGMGHALSVAVIGAIALSTREALPWDLISSVSERLVGVLLIGMGIWGIRSAFRHRLHSHSHRHASVSHEHAHVHLGVDDAARSQAHAHGHSAFGIGALHGLAGGSHLLVAVASLAFPTIGEAVLYLTAYTIGTVAAMTLFCATLSRLLLGASGASERERRLPMALGISSLAALICGGFWIVV